MDNSICFVGGGLKGGGQERALTSLANFYAHQGNRVSIINLFRTEHFFTLNSKIMIYWPNLNRRKYHRFTYAMSIIPFLRRTIKNIKPDVIIGFGEWFNPFIIFSTRLLNIPLYVCDRMGPEMKMDRFNRISRRLLYKYANGVIVQTNTAARIVAKKTGVRNIAVIPNPLNPVDYMTLSKKNYIVSLGRLSPEKGHIYLIRAFSTLPHKEWMLHIVGDGPEMLKLQNEANNLGIMDRVYFHGHLRDFNKILAESSIFVLPSLVEGYPNALIEAMSVPLPCISSDCVAGPSDIIREKVNGLLVEPGNTHALATAMNLLIENPVLRESLACEAYKIRETLAFNKIAKLYTDFIFNEQYLKHNKVSP